MSEHKEPLSTREAIAAAAMAWVAVHHADIGTALDGLPLHVVKLHALAFADALLAEAAYVARWKEPKETP